MAKKIYVGVNETEKSVNFTTCPYSSSNSDWVAVNAPLEYSFTNEYGKWIASATDTFSAAGLYPYMAFDPLSSSDTAWGTLNSSSLIIKCPSGVLIKPSQIHVAGIDNSNKGTPIYGIREDETEELLGKVTEYPAFEADVNVSTGNYFSAFKIVYDNVTSQNRVSKFFVTSGIIKTPPKTDIARKVAKAYVGVDSVARKIKKGYIGVDGVARLFYDGRTPVTTSQLFFKTWTYTDGDRTITGQSTTSLQDGTTPTLTLITTSTNGFLHSKTATSDYTNVYATDVSGNSNTSTSYINSILERTSYNSSTYIYMRGYSNPTVNFVYDFKESRKLTLNMRIYFAASNTTCSFYGSNDRSSWTKIGDVAKSVDVAITSNIAYRYYKVESTKHYDMKIFYMYFTNIDDWN